MCGVCGVVRPSGRVEGDDALVGRINLAQEHRGPDAADRWGGKRVTLGQTRLAIVDLSDAGRQPFVSPDGQVSVVFNGEIYNHEELRRRFRLHTTARCDGAILPELWTRLGTAMFRELRGMFAVAVYDDRDRTLTLARDPFGIKPLYWTVTADGAIAFASECRPLIGLVPRPAVDRAALTHYLMFGSMSRTASPFSGIRAVPANGWVRWDDRLGRTEGPVHRGVLTDLPETSPDELRAEFLRSVSLHLLSDVPVALLLSSGLDSGALAWACRELGQSLICVTVDQGTEMGEGSNAAVIARRFGHRHEIVTSSPDEADVRHYLAAMQRPSIDGLNVFVVNRAIASLGLKVALSGTGGDEVLAGYPWFRQLRRLGLLRVTDRLGLARPLERAVRLRHRKVAQLVGPTGPRDAAGFGEVARRLLLDPDVRALAPWYEPRPARASTGDRTCQALLRFDIEHYLGGMLLADTDTFSMASSVEVRVPFVDVPFARRALAVDPARGVGKRRFADWLGDEELIRSTRRPKWGFGLPMDRWMREGPLAPWVRAAGAPDAPVRELLRPAAVDTLLAGWREGQLRWERAWIVVALDGWLRTLDPQVVRLDDATGHALTTV
ncbi:asparagine synthase (glutamine-hydrolyzing) [Micromonospora sp. NBRC 110038]|uniref:asparagine synthase (glutamine-hydrolyzing) n=1 Tax=Micromonospora sp. NBRC 110038 TaxID=1550034 RepID=UPI001E3AAFF8|nr:asparagine synthase (glutamine-hydrolyzing) [Micromonospora sp. NBRC 110038]